MGFNFRTCLRHKKPGPFKHNLQNDIDLRRNFIKFVIFDLLRDT